MKCMFLMLLAPACCLAQGPVMQAVTPLYETAKLNFVEAAAAMPEGDYSFKLSPAQRAYGDWVDHTAGMNFRLCSLMKGEGAPASAAGDKSKAALEKALQDSFSYCDATLKAMTDENATKEITAGSRKTTPLALMISQIAGLNEHYGNMVGYLRAKGITPPSTARAQKK
jgi:hypothetical protein